MIVTMGHFVAQNWKWISVAGTLLLSGAGAVYSHVEGADDRFDALEMQAVRDSAQLEVIEQDVSDVKCMVVQNAQGEDPLECIQ